MSISFLALDASRALARALVRNRRGLGSTERLVGYTRWLTGRRIQLKVRRSEADFSRWVLTNSARFRVQERQPLRANLLFAAGGRGTVRIEQPAPFPVAEEAELAPEEAGFPFTVEEVRRLLADQVVDTRRQSVGPSRRPGGSPPGSTPRSLPRSQRGRVVEVSPGESSRAQEGTVEREEVLRTLPEEQIQPGAPETDVPEAVVEQPFELEVSDEGSEQVEPTDVSREEGEEIVEADAGSYEDRVSAERLIGDQPVPPASRVQRKAIETPPAPPMDQSAAGGQKKEVSTPQIPIPEAGSVSQDGLLRYPAEERESMMPVEEGATLEAGPYPDENEALPSSVPLEDQEALQQQPFFEVDPSIARGLAGDEAGQRAQGAAEGSAVGSESLAGQEQAVDQVSRAAALPYEPEASGEPETEGMPETLQELRSDQADVTTREGARAEAQRETVLPEELSPLGPETEATEVASASRSPQDIARAYEAAVRAYAARGEPSTAEVVGEADGLQIAPEQGDEAISRVTDGSYESLGAGVEPVVPPENAPPQEEAAAAKFRMPPGQVAASSSQQETTVQGQPTEAEAPQLVVRPEGPAGREIPLQRAPLEEALSLRPREAVSERDVFRFAVPSAAVPSGILTRQTEQAPTTGETPEEEQQPSATSSEQAEQAPTPDKREALSGRDLEELAERVYELILERIRIERERLGPLRW